MSSIASVNTSTPKPQNQLIIEERSKDDKAVVSPNDLDSSTSS